MHERAEQGLIVASELSRGAMQVLHPLWNPCGLLERHLGFISREISWRREETHADGVKALPVRAGGFGCLNQLMKPISSCRIVDGLCLGFAVLHYLEFTGSIQQKCCYFPRISHQCSWLIRPGPVFLSLGVALKFVSSFPFHNHQAPINDMRRISQI